ncbi:MAG: hypothetical protein J3Q66DRAFT_398055 [Benniella sp.]|nr:MAG: hypothetical protein J3Q66DRAFT_398055 [Benniella sp.]
MATATIHDISNRKMRKGIFNPTPPLLQQCADLSLIGSHETRIIARVLNAFCLQFQRADIFWNELSTVVLEMESLLRRVISSPFRHSLLKSLIRYNDEAVDSLDCLARMRLFAIMKGRSPRDSMMRMQLFNSMVSAIKRSGKVRAKFWKPLLSVARQEQRRSSYCGFQATLDLLEEVRKKNIMNHWTFLKQDGTTGKQEAHLDSLTHSTSHSRSLSSFTWVFSKPTTRHQSSGEAGNGCRRQRDRQSCKFVRKPDLGVEHSDAHRKWLQLNKTDEFYRRHIRHPTITDQPDTSTSQFVVASQETNITACCLWELQQCGMDVGLDGGQVAKTFSGDRITVSLTIVNCLRSLTQTWISQMRIPLAQDLDHDQGPQSTRSRMAMTNHRTAFKGRYCSMIWISSTTIPLAGRQGLNTARSGDLYTPQGFSREAQRVTYKAIVLGVFKENTMFDWNWPMLGIIGNQEAYHLFARFTGFETPPPKINIQLYVGISRVHQQLIKYSGEAGNGYHDGIFSFDLLCRLFRQLWNSLPWEAVRGLISQPLTHSYG